MSAEPCLLPDVQRPVAQPVNKELTRIFGMLRGVAVNELRKCRRDPRRENWAVSVGRTMMKNYGATRREAVIATLLDSRTGGAAQ
jgi:hypothetical protein